MKKINEGPTVHSDHRGHHLRNADGEIVQSFKKDREGLKHARQSMYKNFKGLNMKKPEPEQPVEEDMDTNITEPFTKSGMKKHYKDANAKKHPSATNKEVSDSVPDDHSRKPWDFFKGRPSVEEGIHDQDTINEDSYSQYVELAKRNNATTYEQVIDLLSQQGLSEEEMYNIADYIMNVIEESQQTTEDRKMSELENKLKEQLEEGIVVNTTSDSDPNVEDTINVSAQGEDALELMAMLKMAGIGSQEAEVEASVEETPCSASNDIDDMANMIKIISLDDVEEVEEEVDLANAPDEKYADTDTLVNKISGGLNRQKKSYAKAEDGDNPMAVESDESDTKYINDKPLDEYSLEELEAERDILEQELELDRAHIKDMHYKDKMRLEVVYDLIADYEDGEQASNANGTQSFKESEEIVQVTESEEELTARLLKEYDEFKVTAPEDSDEGDWEIENVGKWAVKIGKTSDTAKETTDELFDPEWAGALADEAMAEADEELNEDDVEEGIKIIRKADGKCIGGHCDEKEESPKVKDALDKEMSEDKS